MNKSGSKVNYIMNDFYELSGRLIGHIRNNLKIGIKREEKKYKDFSDNNNKVEWDKENKKEGEEETEKVVIILRTSMLMTSTSLAISIHNKDKVGIPLQMDMVNLRCIKGT